MRIKRNRRTTEKNDVPEFSLAKNRKKSSYSLSKLHRRNLQEIDTTLSWSLKKDRRGCWKNNYEKLGIILKITREKDKVCFQV